MASGVTHILLMKYLQNNLPEDKLKMILADGRDFLQIGAVGPDLPYASIADNDFFFSDQSDLANKFHCVRTHEIPLRALDNLRYMKGGLTKQEARYIFCFFVGYISHIVADGITHPFIRDMVGDYKGHRTEHRRLEMQLDVLLFHYLTKYSGSPIELNYSNVHDELINFNYDAYPELRKVIELFIETIQATYGETYEAETILGWVTGLHRMFDIAEGEHPAIYKNIGFIEDFLFPNYEELRDKCDYLLTLRKPIDRQENFLKIDKIHFFDDVVPRFYDQFIPIANKAYDYIYNDGMPLTEADVRPIDLDTGRILASNNNLDLRPSYWS